jgi:exodeoxyribonuclease VII large subunit
MSITELNDRTRNVVEQSFGVFWVRGEITDFKKHKNGHWYFCLRDSTSQMQCVVWSKDQFRIPAPPDEGMEIVAQAMMSFYQQRGQIQLRIGRMEAAGDGLWRKAMEQTIAKLRGEGLLDIERKRSLPRFPKCIAVVTSTSGAAIRDIVSVAHRRRPGLRIVVSGAVVQGELAPRSICHAISRVMSWGCADVLIVGRGGGSRDDLWAFNHETVARSIAGCTIPTISAVGHEIDTTICDLVADARAATPSAAAEAAVPSLSEIISGLELQKRRLIKSVDRRRESAVLDLKTIARDMRLASSRSVERRRALIASAARQLNALSPLATLARGYAIARDPESGATLSSVADFTADSQFDLTLRDGTIRAVARADE